MSEILHAVRVKRPEYLNRYLRRMITVLTVMAGALFVARDMVFTIVQSSMIMNSIIAAVFVVGVSICFRNVYRIKCDLKVLCDLDEILFVSRDAKALLNYDEKMFIMTDLYKSLENSTKESGEIPEIPTPVARSMVNIANNRFEERRIRIGYFVNLLIYMGLLGTFIGLSATVGSISGLISNLAMGLSGEQDITETLVVLIKHLEHPLAGMGTAFGTSLTGLSSSVVLGALAMSVNKAATLFSNCYSNWIYEYAMTSFTAGIEKHKGNLSENGVAVPTPTSGAAGNPAYSQKTELALTTIEQHLQTLLANQQTLIDHHKKQLSALGNFYQQTRTHNQAVLENHKNQLSALTDLHQHSTAHNQTLLKNHEKQLSALTRLSRHSGSQNEVLDSIQQTLSKHDPDILYKSVHQLTESFTTASEELQKQTRLQVEEKDREDARDKKSVTQRHKIIESQHAALDLMKKQVEGSKALYQQSQKLPGFIAATADKRLKETEQTLSEQYQNGQDELGKVIEKGQSSHTALLLRLFKALHRLYRIVLFRNR